MPTLTEAELALHRGDPGPREELWSHDDPVTLFGAVLTESGWGPVEASFRWLAERFSDVEAWSYEVVGAGASGDLGYVAGVEHTRVRVNGADPETYDLRVTAVYRREAGRWRQVHRHGDPLPQSDSARRQMRRMTEGRAGPEP
ncbi:SnoaL-like protein [Georgenia soli]|uniref:SnoaL-like protein n=1 Tax=Georgenia soli TaxID=638953 RepID=A0A2A9EIS0_9MICO|nr:nuclear transport factor 2 family protein [Georgenia soli]PFG38798.1 SnoaL-like protein [Georgenia soli]